MHTMKRKGLTVGSLLGVPQTGGALRSDVRRLVPLPPIKLGRGCCRSGCPGCPWAAAQRRARNPV
jgi:hypothetical protein